MAKRLMGKQSTLPGVESPPGYWAIFVQAFGEPWERLDKGPYDSQEKATKAAREFKDKAIKGWEQMGVKLPAGALIMQIRKVTK